MKYLQQLMLAVTLLISASAAVSQTCATTEGVTTCHYNIPDDGHAIVPIPFGFPFYGQVFTHSIFFDNGAVSFYSPTQPQRWGGAGFGGIAINDSLSSSFFYTIMPLRTDLIANGGTHFTQGNENFFTYNWNNVSEFGRWDSRNTFSVEIRPTGYIGLQYDRIDLTRPWTSAIIGNASVGEFQLIQSQPDWGVVTTSIDNWSINSTGSACADPLSNINCPGYAEAFLIQQCSISALYSPACPGYDDALLAQQCSISVLNDPRCPGYAVAYYDQQCGLDALYHTGCPGYDDAYLDQQCGSDPLYDSRCEGYSDAFFDQQCGLDPLYDTACPLYADAFYVQQCSLDPLYDSGCTGYDAAFLTQQCALNSLYDPACPGYATAFFNQQCGLNSLYDPLCPGYAQAFFDQQCGLNTLYDSACPGYAQAFFDQQCGLDPLYDRTCPGYAEAFAKKYILEDSASVPATAATMAEPEPMVETAIVAETTVATADPADTTAAVQLVSEPAAATTTAAAADAPRTETAAAAPAPRTTRQALAERRLAAARAQAESRARENPAETAAALDSAESMEQQVEVQNVVLGAMSFVPGFDAYGRAVLPDAAFYAPTVIYPGQQNIDTPAARGLLGRSDRLHQEMIDEQYR